MRILLFLLFLTVWLLPFGVQESHAQSRAAKKALREAVDLYKQEYYEEAIPKFQQAFEEIKDEPLLPYRLAQCYEKTLVYFMAEKWYERAYDAAPKQAADALLQQAIMEKYLRKYDEAIKHFEQFITEFEPQHPEDSTLIRRAKLEKAGALRALNFWEKEPQLACNFRRLEAPLSSRSLDYAPVFKPDEKEVVFLVSERLMENEATQMQLSDFFAFAQHGQEWKELGNNLLNKLNTRNSEGPGVFSPDGQSFYFTRCEAFCQIMVTHQEGNSWSNPQALPKPINRPEASSKQPALSATGDTLFFVAKWEEGRGENDIWYSTRRNGQWGKPQMVPGQVNTPFMDMSPYYSSSHQALFFATNGQKSMGGIDLYMAKGPDFQELHNLGMPFNGSFDDFYLFLGPNSGLMSSCRTKHGAVCDIYRFDYPSIGYLVEAVEAEKLPEPLSTQYVPPEEAAEDPLKQYQKLDDSSQNLVNELVASATPAEKETTLAHRKKQLRQLDQLQKLPPDKQRKVKRIVATKMIMPKAYQGREQLRKADQKRFQRLPIEEKKRIKRLAKVRIGKAQQAYQGNDELKAYDQQYLKNLPPEDRQFLERIIATRLNTAKAYGNQPELLRADTAYLNQLKKKAPKWHEQLGEDSEEPGSQATLKKDWLERFTHYRMGDTTLYNNRPELKKRDKQFYKKLPKKEKQTVDRIISLRIGRKAMYQGDPYQELQDLQQLEKLPTERRNIVETMARVRLGKKTVAGQDSIGRAKAYGQYQKLEPEEQQQVDRLVALRMDAIQVKKAKEKQAPKTQNQPIAKKTAEPDTGRAPAALLPNTAQEKALQQYQALPQEKQALVDRLVQNQEPGNLTLPKRRQLQQDLRSLQKYPKEEQKRLQRIVLAKLTEPMAYRGRHQLRKKDRQRFQQLPIEEKRRVQRLVQVRIGKKQAQADPNSLYAQDRRYLQNLPENKRQFIERIMALKTDLHDVYGGKDELLAQDKAYLEGLSIKERKFLQRLTLHRMGHPTAYQQNPELKARDKRFYQKLPPEERRRVDRIVTLRMGRKAMYEETPDLELADFNNYQKLPTQKRNIIDRVAKVRLGYKDSGMGHDSLDTKQVMASFDSLSENEKEEYNRMVALRMEEIEEEENLQPEEEIGNHPSEKTQQSAKSKPSSAAPAARAWLRAYRRKAYPIFGLVGFPGGSAKVYGQDQALPRQMMEEFQAKGPLDVWLVVEGHAAPSEPTALAQKRAQALAQALQAAGAENVRVVPPAHTQKLPLSGGANQRVAVLRLVPKKAY